MPDAMATPATTGSRLDFPRSEYEQRLERVRGEMRRLRCDALVVDAIESIAYLTGLTISGTRYQACLVFLDRDPVMVLRSIDEETLLDTTWLSDYVLFGDSEDPVAVVQATLAKHGVAGRRIGFELDSNFLTVQVYQRLREALSEAAPVDFAGVLWELRLRKSPAEVELIRKAAAIAGQTMTRVMQAAAAGVWEREVAAVAASSYFERGASDGHLGPLTSGRRTGSIHGQLGDHVLEPGDVLHVELVPEYRGYSARLMRSATIGPPSSDQERAIAVMIEAQDEQIAAMRPGAVAGEVDRILRDRILAAGLRERFDNVSGYTLGFYGTPRSPRASDFTRCFLPGSSWLLEPGMTFHMYVFAGGLSLSETVLVGEHAPERLTTHERKLYVR
jgi:Xaa-Pro aminopeptidase